MTAAEYLQYLIEAQQSFVNGEAGFGIQVSELKHLEMFMNLEKAK